MADQTTTASAPKQTQQNAAFDFSMRITFENYQALEKERDDIAARQLQAANEFMFQHYARVLKAINESLARASGVKVQLDKKRQREESKVRQAEIRAAREQAQIERLQKRVAAARGK